MGVHATALRDAGASVTIVAGRGGAAGRGIRVARIGEADSRGPLGTCCSGRLQATLLNDDTVLVEGGQATVRQQGREDFTASLAELVDRIPG